MANFSTVAQVDITNYQLQTASNAYFLGAFPGIFQYYNATISFAGYGPTVMGLPVPPPAGTVTDILIYTGPVIPLVSPAPPPITLITSFSGLSVDAGTVATFFSASTQTDSLNSLASILAGDDTLTGSAFDDVLSGFAGLDAIDGGLGIDTASYVTSSAGVAIDLAGGIARGGDAAGDTLTSIENLTGSAFRDTLAGDANDNVLSGGDGNDKLIGGAGADTLAGGDGVDTASYAASSAGVQVDLSLSTAKDGDAEGDILSGIENLIGSALSDGLTGDAQNNRLEGLDGGDSLIGLDGNDTLVGGGGNDGLYGGIGNDTLNGDDGNDQLIGDSGNDRMTGGDGDDYLQGGDGADRLTGGDGKDILLGNEGRDVLVGGDGVDTFGFTILDGTIDVIRDWQDGEKIGLSFDAGGIDLATVITGTSTRDLEGEGVFYNSANGRLYVFDSDNDVLTHFATLSNKPALLDAGDFLVV